MQRWHFSDLLAIAAGAMLPLAFAPFNGFPIALFAMAVLFGLWHHYPQRAMWQAWLFCVGQLGFGISWLHISFHEFSGVALWLAVFLTALFVAFIAAYFLLAGWLTRWRSQSAAWNFLLFFPLIWLLIEWFKGWFLTGFPWLSLGYSQIDNAPLAGFGSLLGVYGISWAVLISAGGLALMVVEKRLRLSALITLVLVWGVGWVNQQIDWTHDEPQSIAVSVVQGNIRQDRKWLPQQRKPTLDLYRSMTEAHWDSDLIIWPETAVPAMYHQVKSFYLEPLAQAASEHQSVLLIGVPVVENGVFFNSVVALGEKTQFYHKAHLVPFGEFMPLRSVLEPILDFLSIPLSNFQSGRYDQPLLTVNNVPIDMTICYEDAFGEEIIRHLPQAKILVNVSNDAWFGDSLAPHQHLQMARMRALETGRTLIRSTNTGISAIITPKGKVRQRLAQFKRGVLVAHVKPRTGTTPYVWWGNGMLVGLMGLLFGVHGLRTRRELSQRELSQRNLS